MSKDRDSLVPLSEINLTQKELTTGTESQGSLKFMVELPEYIDQTKIGVNVGQINKFAKLAGVGLLAVYSSSDDETTSQSVSVDGITSKSVGLAGKVARFNIVPTSKTRYKRLIFSPFQPQPSIWLTAGIKLNTQEMAQRIKGNPKYQGDLRSVNAWSWELDRGLKTGLVNISADYNLNSLAWKRKAYTLLINTGIVNAGLAFGVMEGAAYLTGTRTGLLLALGLPIAVFNALHLIEGTSWSSETSLLDPELRRLTAYRWSLLRSFPIEHHLKLKLQSKYMHTIMPIN